MQDCIFCKIVRGEIPSSKVYEDPDVLAFRDINPQAPVHILIVPKGHVADVMSLGDGDAELQARLMRAAQVVAKEQGVAGSGFRLVTNTGLDSGQVVFHLHWHLLGGAALGRLC